MEYVNLIIDNSNDKTDMLYTYASEIEGLKPGDKVTVPFARGNKEYDAYVHSMADGPDPRIKYKYVISKNPLVSLPSDAVEICEFMRQRYFAGISTRLNVSRLRVRRRRGERPQTSLQKR